MKDPEKKEVVHYVKSLGFGRGCQTLCGSQSVDPYWDWNTQVLPDVCPDSVTGVLLTDASEQTTCKNCLRSLNA